MPQITARNARRLMQLQARLQTLTDIYAPFFAGFESGDAASRSNPTPKTARILLDLQFLTRAPHLAANPLDADWVYPAPAR